MKRFHCSVALTWSSLMIMVSLRDDTITSSRTSVQLILLLALEFLFYLFLPITEFAKWPHVQIIHAFTALMSIHLSFWSLNVIQDAFKTRWKRELVFTSSRECGTSPDKHKAVWSFSHMLWKTFFSHIPYFFVFEAKIAGHVIRVQRQRDHLYYSSSTPSSWWQKKWLL